MNTPNEEDRDITVNSAYNPFPEPQTIPSGWDLSGLFCEPQAGPDMDEEEAAEE